MLPEHYYELNKSSLIIAESIDSCSKKLSDLLKKEQVIWKSYNKKFYPGRRVIKDLDAARLSLSRLIGLIENTRRTPLGRRISSYNGRLIPATIKYFHFKNSTVTADISKNGGGRLSKNDLIMVEKHLSKQVSKRRQLVKKKLSRKNVNIGPASKHIDIMRSANLEEIYRTAEKCRKIIQRERKKLFRLSMLVIQDSGKRWSLHRRRFLAESFKPIMSSCNKFMSSIDSTLGTGKIKTSSSKSGKHKKKSWNGAMWLGGNSIPDSASKKSCYRQIVGMTDSIIIGNDKINITAQIMVQESIGRISSSDHRLWKSLDIFTEHKGSGLLDDISSGVGLCMEEVPSYIGSIPDRKAKLFGAYAWFSFDGTIPVGKYAEDSKRMVEILEETGCNLYVHGANQGVSPSIEAAGLPHYYGRRANLDGSILLGAGNFDVAYDYSGGYGPDKSSWDEFIDILEETKGKGIKIFASTGEKHHLRNVRDNGDGTYTIYPDRWGMHKYSTPAESTDSMILRMRELAQMTLPVYEGGMGYDHLIGLLHDDTTNSVGMGLNYPGEFEFGYTPDQINSISEAARDINPKFEFIPTSYYQHFGKLFATDGIELGCKTKVSGFDVGMRPGLVEPYTHDRGAEGASAYYTFNNDGNPDDIRVSFSYQDLFRPQDEEGEAHYEEYLLRSQSLHKECYLNQNLIFSEDLSDNDIISFFESDDVSEFVVSGNNTLEFRFWNKGTTTIQYLPKQVWFWDMKVSIDGEDASLTAPTFYTNDKDLQDGLIPSTKMFARSNDVKAIHSSLTSISPVYPKNLTGVPKDHTEGHYKKVLEMVRRHLGDINMIEQERAFAWGSPINPDTFSMKINEASKVADGVLVYNLVTEVLNKKEQLSVFQEPNVESEMQYSKVAWTPTNYEPKAGYFREWKTMTRLSGKVTFDIFLPQLNAGEGKYDFYIYDESDTLLYSGHNGDADLGVKKEFFTYGYGVGVSDGAGGINPIILDLTSPTKLRFLWKVKGSYGAQYNYLKFRIVLGEMSKDYFGSGAIYREDSPTYVYNDDGDVLEVYSRELYSYRSSLTAEADDEFGYTAIVNAMSNLYKGVLTDVEYDDMPHSHEGTASTFTFEYIDLVACLASSLGVDI